MVFWYRDLVADLRVGTQNNFLSILGNNLWLGFPLGVMLLGAFAVGRLVNYYADKIAQPFDFKGGIASYEGLRTVPTLIVRAHMDEATAALSVLSFFSWVTARIWALLVILDGVVPPKLLTGIGYRLFLAFLVQDFFLGILSLLGVHSGGTPAERTVDTIFMIEGLIALMFAIASVPYAFVRLSVIPLAIYYYMGRPYGVVRMQLRDSHLSLRRERYWTTRPISNTMVFPRFNGGILALAGDPSSFLVESEVQVSERVTGFQEQRGGKKLEPQKYGPNSTWYRRELTRFFETTGVCWHVKLRTALTEDIGHRILQAFCFEFGVQERDLGVGLFHSRISPFNTAGKFHGLCIYDAVNGSLRLTQRLAENFADVVLAAARKAEAEGESNVSKQLLEFHLISKDLVPSAFERALSEVGVAGEWTEVIAPGEKAIYVSEDGPREVTVIGYRFTPKGLVYDLVPEKADAKWMVAAHALQPMHGFTRTIEVDLMTGDERAAIGSTGTEAHGESSAVGAAVE